MVLTFGSFATEIHEPCQVRNEAALSETFCVPEGSLDRANCIGNVCGLLFEVRRAVFYFIVDIITFFNLLHNIKIPTCAKSVFVSLTCVL